MLITEWNLFRLLNFNSLKANMTEANLFVDRRIVYHRTDVQAADSFYVDIGRAQLSRTDAELEAAE